MITGLLIGFLAYWFCNKTHQTIKTQRIKALGSTCPPGPDGCFPVKINRVKDGDTIQADFIKLPWNCGLVNVDIRLYGFDAWEITKKRKSVKISNSEISKGEKAKAALVDLIGKARWAYLRPESVEIDCYGRILGSLFLQIPGEDALISVSEWMIANHHNRT